MQPAADQQLQTRKANLPFKVAGQPASLTMYLGSLPLNAPEREVLAKKYSAPPFRTLSVNERLTMAKVLVVKIHTITGWQIPDDTVTVVLVDQLSKHLLESYPTVNIEEVEYAFRKYGSNVKDWGNAMNLILFDQVMVQYLTERRGATVAEEDAVMRNQPETEAQPAYTDDQLIELSRISFRHYLRNQPYGSVELIYNCYEVLRRLEMMPKPTEPQSAEWLRATKARYNLLTEKDPLHFKGLDITLWGKGYLQKLAIIHYFTHEKEQQ